MLLVLSLATYGFPGGTDGSFKSLRSAVEKAIKRFGWDPSRVEYSFFADDILNPGKLKNSGWDSDIRHIWLYAHELDSGCYPLKDAKFIDQSLYGYIVENRERTGDTTRVGIWEVECGPGLSFSQSDVGLTGSGDTAYVLSGGDYRLGGSISRISHDAVYFNGIAVQPEAEKAERDTLIFEDDSGKRLVCGQIVSIAITVNNGIDYFSNVAPHGIKPSRLIRRAALPPECPSDTGEAILREINNAIAGYSFTIRNEDDQCPEALFRTRMDCKRYQRRCK